MATDKDFLDAGAQIVAGAVIIDGKTVGHYNHGNFILTDEGMRLSEKMAAEDVEVIIDGKTVGYYNHGNFILTDEGMRLSEKMAAEDVEVIIDGKTVGYYNHGNFILTDEGMRLSEKMAAEDVEVERTVTRKPAKKAGTDAADGEADAKE